MSEEEKITKEDYILTNLHPGIRLDKEVEKYVLSDNDEEFVYKNINTLLSLIEKKDKIIDLMAEKLEGLLVLNDSYSSEDDYLLLKNKEEVKQYFENKAKES